MLVHESREGRRIVGRFDRGVDLLDALVAVCRDHHVRAGALTAHGWLERVVIADHDAEAHAARPARALAGGLALLSLAGTIAESEGGVSVDAHVLVGRERDTGLEVVGGALRAARCLSVDFVLETFDDLALRRGLDPQSGLHVLVQVGPLRGPAEGREAPAAPPPRSEWSDVVRAAEEAAEAAAREEENADDGGGLEVGDIILHPRFGRCEVQRIEGAYEYAHIRLKNDRIVRLSLDVIKITLTGREGEHRVFQARIDA